MGLREHLDVKSLILIALLIGLAGVMAVLMPSETLDSHLYYTGEQARAILGRLDTEGLQKYLRVAWVDLFFIATYSTLLDRWCGKTPGFRFHRGIAFLPGFFDLIETTFIIALLLGAPLDRGLDYLGAITAFKWVTAVALVLGLTFSKFYAKINPTGT